MNSPNPPTVIALDLEGTLISNASSCFVRPGLSEFLEFCRASFARVVVFTAVREPRVRFILRRLAEEGDIPCGSRTSNTSIGTARRP